MEGEILQAPDESLHGFLGKRDSLISSSTEFLQHCPASASCPAPGVSVFSPRPRQAQLFHTALCVLT